MRSHSSLTLPLLILALFLTTSPFASGLPLTFEKQGSLEPGIEDPRAIAFDAEGRLHVGGDGVYRVFDSDNKALADVPTARQVSAITVAPSGLVYTAQGTWIEVYDADGAKQRAWGTEGTEPGQLKYVTSLAVRSNTLLAADYGNRRVTRFAVNGDPVDAIDSGLLVPSPYFDVAVDAEGILWVANPGRHRIERYDNNLEKLGQWGQFGSEPANFSGCCNPTHIALLPTGEIVTSEKGFPRLQLFSRDGELLAHLGDDEFDELAMGLDIAVDSDGRIAVLVPDDNEVRFYRLKPAAP